MKTVDLEHTIQISNSKWSDKARPGFVRETDKKGRPAGRLLKGFTIFSANLTTHSCQSRLVDDRVGQWRKYLTENHHAESADGIRLSNRQATRWPTELTRTTSQMSGISCWAYFKVLCISADYRHSGHAIFFISHEKLRRGRNEDGPCCRPLLGSLFSS